MSEQKQPTIAEELSAARQARGLSIEEACQQSGVSLAVIQGLEAGQFDVVEPVFVRLALQEYAEFLELDPEPLLTRFGQQHGRSFQPRPRPAVLLSQPVSRRSHKPLIIISSIIGACCVLAGAFHFFGDALMPPPQAASPTAAPPQAAPPPPQTAQAQPITAAPADSLVSESDDAPAPTTTAQTPGLVVLELEARDSTWVQVRWDDAAENFEAIVPPGQRHRFEARDHFLVLSTRPHGLRYWLDGQLLGGGQLGDPGEVLHFRAAADGIEFLSLDPQTSAEEAPDAQP